MVETAIQVKTCNECQEVKPLEEFGVSKKGKYGRRAKCRKCYNAQAQEARLRNTKQCSRCEQSKPKDNFASSAVSKDGLFAWCQACKLAADQERRGRLPKSQPNKEENVESIFASYSDQEVLLAVGKLRSKRKKVACPSKGCESKARLTSPWWPFCELHRDTAQKVNLKKVRKELEIA